MHVYREMVMRLLMRANVVEDAHLHMPTIMRIGIAMILRMVMGTHKR